MLWSFGLMQPAVNYETRNKLLHDYGPPPVPEPSLFQKDGETPEIWLDMTHFLS